MVSELSHIPSGSGQGHEEEGTKRKKEGLGEDEVVHTREDEDEHGDDDGREEEVVRGSIWVDAAGCRNRGAWGIS